MAGKVRYEFAAWVSGTQYLPGYVFVLHDKFYLCFGDDSLSLKGNVPGINYREVACK